MTRKHKNISIGITVTLLIIVTYVVAVFYSQLRIFAGGGGVSANGSVLAEVGAFRAETVNPPQKHHRSRNADDTTDAPILANTCYQQPFYQSFSKF